ncbi:Saccharopine dehydrogenase-domain-containing protein [Tribonema minus]|uniref:Saccharopine dehydrogenase-domain-containing protein n=1 Tax=Tribonema minus TaxID=303371 RepID=A0A835ZKY4_9STRA|nr:Saccharopine dehydrogenase-domain-containing protein [Tribonema minus]
MRPFQVVVYGATGFCGQLVCEYLAKNYATTGLRWALAGRSEPKLISLKRSLGPGGGDTPHLVADAADTPALEALARVADVVVAAAGPYGEVGSGLVAACAATGTHLVDLAGESVWMKEMIEKHHDTASVSGAKIVHSCGFDSIPADLGTMLAHMRLRDVHNTKTKALSYYFGKFGLGGFSGMLERQQLRGDVLRPLSAVAQRRAAPSATKNTQVCRFRGQLAGLLPALLTTAAVAFSNALFYLPPTRALLQQVAPASGEGPPASIRENSFFEIYVEGHGANGAHVLATVGSDKGDAGYQETCKMLAESALALALNTTALPQRTGILTPASALGMVLVERLRAAGMVLSVETVSLPSG